MIKNQELKKGQKMRWGERWLGESGALGICFFLRVAYLLKILSKYATHKNFSIKKPAQVL